MSELTSLVDRLNTVSRSALEKSVSLCMRRSQFNVELEHWLLVLLEDAQSSFYQLLQSSEISILKLTDDIQRRLEQAKIGNDQAPAISSRVIDLINEAWLVASLDFKLTHINSSHLLLALARNTLLLQVAQGISQEFSKLSPETILLLMKQQPDIESSHEDNESIAGSPTSQAQNALNQFTMNLNEQARQGKLDAAIGREYEVRQTIDILGRRRQNNAIFVGEPGVGKTAIAEGLALRIVEGNVPESLKSVVVHSLDLGLLQAGAGVKGEFENRLKNLIKAIKESTHPIILFIDEAHTIIGAGGQAGQGDAANLLKPALARGELRCIAATTWAEYKQYFEKDAALTRRFQVVKINEPTAEVATHMLRSVAINLEKHHQVTVLDSAIKAATNLSQQYISGRQLPDKSISVLDTACSRVASQQTAEPAVLEYARKHKEQLILELERLKKNIACGLGDEVREKTLEKDIQQWQDKIAALAVKWQKEKKLSEDIVGLYQRISSGHEQQIDQCREAIKRYEKTLDSLHQDQPLVSPFVGEQAVADVVADWTGIPVGRMVKADIDDVLDLDKVLAKRIIAQDQAIKRVAESVKISKAKLSDPGKPRAVFLFVGPSGVGKTETALALAEEVYGSSSRMSVINMSEFKEEHKVSMLAGAPPGYVGYGEGGVLTEAVRREPYSLVLLDEIEKAHPGVQEVFYQVFDKGMLKDGQGCEINFKNTTLIMTSNACSSTIEDLYAGREEPPTMDEVLEVITPELEKIFKPAFLGRVTVIPYCPLNHDAYDRIIDLKVSKIIERMAFEHQVKLKFMPTIKQYLLSNAATLKIGARQIDNLINRDILPKLSTLVLSQLLAKKTVKQISVSYNAKLKQVMCKVK